MMATTLTTTAAAVTAPSLAAAMGTSGVTCHLGSGLMSLR